MKIVLNNWFNLPRLGTDTFSDLMKAKVKYDKKFGFQFTSSTNVTRALSLLSSALGEECEIARSCFICGGALDEPSEYLGERTLCSSCVGNEDAYDLYVMRFTDLIESV